MMILITIIHAVAIAGLSLLIWRKQTVLKGFFWPALTMKMAAGVILGLVYTYYYSVADTFVYFLDASTLASLAHDNFSTYLDLLFFNRHLETVQLALVEPRALFLTKITSLFSIATHNNYWVIGCYYSLISFLSAWYLVQVIVRSIPPVSNAAIAGFLFLPSVVFWTSGLLKESLSVAALFFLVAAFLKFWFKKKIFAWEYPLIIFSLWVLWNLKYYFAGVFIPVVGTTLIYRFVFKNRFSSSAGLETGIWVCLLTLPVILVSFLHPNFNFDRLLDVIVLNNAAYNSLSDAGDFVRFQELEPTVLSMIRNAPQALFSGLLRPLFWEASSVIQFVAAVENTILLILFLVAGLRSGSYFDSPHRILIVSLVAYVTILAVLITISAPNFGTLSRFRVGYISFFAFIILCNSPVLQYMERSFPTLGSHKGAS